MSYEMRKLLEAVEQLNEAFVEYRDPDGHFQVIYEPPRGYFVIARNDLPAMDGESFDNLDDAIDHALTVLSMWDDEQEYGPDDEVDDGEHWAEMDEDFAEEPLPYGDYYMGSILDREEMPAIPMRLKALDDVPMLYMKKGDEMWVKPTNIMGEVYSEENGLTYDWDSIFHMYQRGMLEVIPDENEFVEPGEMEPYIEEAKGSMRDLERDAAINSLVDVMEAELRSVARSRPNVDDKTLLGMARYILRGMEREVEDRFKDKVDQVSADLDQDERNRGW